MEMTNLECFNRMNVLENHLFRKNFIGYAAARNFKLLKNACEEYVKYRDTLINEYGDPYIDENGNDTGKKFITQASDNFEEFNNKLSEVNDVIHNLDIIKVPYDKTIDELSGFEILELDWMLED